MTFDPDRVDGTILVPIANQETAARQLDTAIQLARDRSYGVRVLFVLPVPPQLSLVDGRRYLLSDDHEDALENAAATVRDAGIPVETTLRISRTIAGSIVSVAADEDVDAILLGWRGRPPRRNVVLGSHVDRVLRNAPCDVLVKRTQAPTPDVESILVPVSDGPHSEYATETAAAMARSTDASIHLLYVLDAADPELSRSAAKQVLDEHQARLEDVAVVERELVEQKNVSGAITDATADHDVTILGVSRGGLFQRALLGSISDAVGRHGAGTVILAKRHDPVPSRLRRVLSPLR